VDERGRRPLTKRQQALAGLHYPLALNLAQRYSRRTLWLQDEILSAAHLGLVKAARRFNNRLHVPFWWFARLVIVSEIAATVRQQLGRVGRQVDLVEWQFVPIEEVTSGVDNLVSRLEEARLSKKQVIQLLAISAESYDQARRRVELPRADLARPLWSERMVGT
jgi:DNA-directed RNA polymerase specialized sigma subunit